MSGLLGAMEAQHTLKFQRMEDQPGQQFKPMTLLSLDLNMVSELLILRLLLEHLLLLM